MRSATLVWRTPLAAVPISQALAYLLRVLVDPMKLVTRRFSQRNESSESAIQPLPHLLSIVRRVIRQFAPRINLASSKLGPCGGRTLSPFYWASFSPHDECLERFHQACDDNRPVLRHSPVGLEPSIRFLALCRFVRDPDRRSSIPYRDRRDGNRNQNRRCGDSNHPPVSFVRTDIDRDRKGHALNYIQEGTFDERR